MGIYTEAMTAYVKNNSYFGDLQKQHKRILIKRRHGDRCYFCDKQLSDDDFHAHHIDKSRYGCEFIEDMVPACSDKVKDGLGCHYEFHREKEMEDFAKEVNKNEMRVFNMAKTLEEGIGVIDFNDKKIKSHFKTSKRTDISQIKASITKLIKRGILIKTDNKKDCTTYKLDFEVAFVNPTCQKKKEIARKKQLSEITKLYNSEVKKNNLLQVQFSSEKKDLQDKFEELQQQFNNLRTAFSDELNNSNKEEKRILSNPQPIKTSHVCNVDPNKSVTDILSEEAKRIFVNTNNPAISGEKNVLLSSKDKKRKTYVPYVREEWTQLNHKLYCYFRDVFNECFAGQGYTIMPESLHSMSSEAYIRQYMLNDIVHNMHVEKIDITEENILDFILFHAERSSLECQSKRPGIEKSIVDYYCAKELIKEGMVSFNNHMNIMANITNSVKVV